MVTVRDGTQAADGTGALDVGTALDGTPRLGDGIATEAGAAAEHAPAVRSMTRTTASLTMCRTGRP